MKLKDVIKSFESVLPVGWQESWDCGGLNLGQAHSTIKSILFSYDVCHEVIRHAIQHKCQLIVSHHPFRMNTPARIDLDDYDGQTVAMCIRNGIALYSCHTHHDNSWHSLNRYYLGQLGATHIKPIIPSPVRLMKLVVFVPHTHSQTVMDALFAAGAGHIGHYSECAFTLRGTGTFKGDITTNPAIGNRGKRTTVAEERIETIVPEFNINPVIRALLKAHPYEEVAYDLYVTQSKTSCYGSGACGQLSQPITEAGLIKKLKQLFKIKSLRVTSGHAHRIQTIGICTGSGASMIAQAKRAGCDAFITGDVKYHQAIDAKRHGLSVFDVGHFDSEKETVAKLMQLFRPHVPKTITFKQETGLKDAFKLV